MFGHLQTRVGVSATANVVFLHVAKTAGTTLVAFLESRFSPSEICPAYYWRELLRIPRDRLEAYKLIRGHFDYCVIQLLRDVRVITLLRDPVERAISYYRYLGSLAHHPLREIVASTPISELLDDPEIGRTIVNYQTELLGGDLDLEELRRSLAQDAPPLFPWNNRPRARRASLIRAKERLASCAFVGIQERFEDGLVLLAYTFGWPPPERFERLNVTPPAEDGPRISEADRRAIQARNGSDAELYAFAAEIFESRFQSMVDDVASSLGRAPASIKRRDLIDVVRERSTDAALGMP